MESNNYRGLHLREVLRVVFKRKREILLVWLGCIVIAAAYSILKKPIYEASSMIFIKVGRENIYVPPLRAAGDSSQVVDSYMEEQMNSEVEIIKSKLLAEKVLSTLGITTIYPPRDSIISTLLGLFKSRKDAGDPHSDKAYGNALRHFEKDLTVEGIKKSKVIRISFRHTDPEIAAKTVNTLTNMYLGQHLKVHQTSLPFDFFREQGSKLKDDLERAEAALNDFKEQHGIVSPEEQKKILLGKESELRAELTRTERLETELQTRVDYYRSRSGPTPAYLNALETLLKSEAELKEVRAKKPILLGQIADYKRELNKLIEAENEFINLQQRVDVCRQNLRFYQVKSQEEHYLAELDKEKVSNLSVIDPARPPVDPVTPMGFIIKLSFLLGGIAGIGLAFFLESLDDRIETEEDVERSLPGLSLLASIPYKS